jgi:hypothetical protein
MKTIRQAIIDEIHYPIGDGFVDNVLLRRGLDADDEISSDIICGKKFIGATADCLRSLVEAPNFSEADKSVSLSDKDLILKRANMLYLSIGEKDNVFGVPTVKVGDCLIP